MIEKPTVYLAGAIRDGVKEDIEWRQRAATRLYDVARILNPLAGKEHHEDTGAWTIYGDHTSDARWIVSADYYAVDHADIIIFDFRALADKYPNIGTLSEWGRSTARSVVRISVVKSDYEGHENKRHYPGLHPFIAEHSAKVFSDIDEAIDFVAAHCLAITTAPFYGTP